LKEKKMYGLLAEFKTTERLVEAATCVRREGYRHVEAYTPFAVEGLANALGAGPGRVAAVTFVGGAVGAAGGYLLQWYAAVLSYPVNIGGRPVHSWPAFVPLTFELTVLVAGLSAALIGVIAFNGLPRLTHPLFNEPAFSRATRDAFFLCIEASDPLFRFGATSELLTSLGASAVFEVDS
jgi:hypothetical protein